MHNHHFISLRLLVMLPTRIIFWAKYGLVHEHIILKYVHFIFNIIYFYLFGERKTEKETNRAPIACSLLKCKDATTWAITYGILGCALAGSWNKEQSFQCEMWFITTGQSPTLICVFCKSLIRCINSSTLVFFKNRYLLLYGSTSFHKVKTL